MLTMHFLHRESIYLVVFRVNMSALIFVELNRMNESMNFENRMTFASIPNKTRIRNNIN